MPEGKHTAETSREMFDALEMFVGSVTKRTENGNIYALGELHAAEEAARKAISKAKGEGSPC